MQTEEFYTIKEAAKKVQVAEHVLRYWEEELGICVERNSLGYRNYSEQNVEVFQNVKKWKEQGMQLKAIRSLLTQEDSGMLQTPALSQDIAALPEEIQDKRAMRLQQLLENLVSKAIRENNEQVIKELDYQFRQLEENAQMREQQHKEREEEYYRRLDEMLCAKSRKRKWKR